MSPVRADPRGRWVLGHPTREREETCRQAHGMSAGAHPKAAPSARREWSPWPVSGLASHDPSIRAPSHARGTVVFARTGCARYAHRLAYRCGGSSRLAAMAPRTGFPFKPRTLRTALRGHREAARMLTEASRSGYPLASRLYASHTSKGDAAAALRLPLRRVEEPNAPQVALGWLWPTMASALATEAQLQGPHRVGPGPPRPSPAPRCPNHGNAPDSARDRPSPSTLRPAARGRGLTFVAGRNRKPPGSPPARGRR